MAADYGEFGSFGRDMTPVAGRPEPVAHPQNCKHECPYGYNRTFCFPCYAKIMNQHKALRHKERK